MSLVTKMFSLFYGLYEYLFRPVEYNVLILGIGNAVRTVFARVGHEKALV